MWKVSQTYTDTSKGPYFGQLAWFKKFHPEPVPSAEERYSNEVKRVSGVLEGYLKRQKTNGDGPWLVGDRISYADISFLSWQLIAVTFFAGAYDPSEFPTVTAWVEKMKNRPAIKKVTETNQHM